MDTIPTPPVDLGMLDELGNQLLWRIGRLTDDSPVTVRVGFASSAEHFGHLPRLRSASEEEVEAALADNTVRVEWVGPRPRAD